MDFCLQHLICYEENPAFLDRIFVSNETWCHYCTPKSKKTSMQWKHSSSPPPRKSKATITAQKKMLSFFLDCRGSLLIEFLPQGRITKLRKAIKNKQPGLLTQGVVVLHDNVCPYISKETQRALNTLRWEVLEHSPYSLDMSPCDFHIFGSLKRALNEKHFHSDDGMKVAMQDFLRNQPQSFYGKAVAATLGPVFQCPW